MSEGEECVEGVVVVGVGVVGVECFGVLVVGVGESLPLLLES